MPIASCQSFMLKLLDGLEMPGGQPPADAYITPPDPRVQARVPAIYIWPSDGDENRSAELGGTVPRNSGWGTPSGTKGVQHQIDVYLTWFAANQGSGNDNVFPGMVDAVMAALRYSQPNPAKVQDPNVPSLTTTIYNVGETMKYRIGLESTEDERWLRYDCLIQCTVWEIMNA